MKIKIREAKPREAKETILVRWKSWLFAYKNIFTKEEINKHFEAKINSQEYIDKIIESIIKKTRWFVAEVENKIVAVMRIGLPTGSDEDAEIYCLYCLPEYLRMGIGSKLFFKAIQIFKKDKYNFFVVCALKDNIIGNSFYIKNGGKKIQLFKKELCGRQVEEVSINLK